MRSKATERERQKIYSKKAGEECKQMWREVDVYVRKVGGDAGGGVDG